MNGIRLSIISAFLAVPALAQFTSGSTGVHGPLNITASMGPIFVFDPTKLNPPITPPPDNVYHFTTINVASGIWVKFSNRVTNGPVVWLATGAVSISGALDLKGDPGGPPFPTSNRSLASPGAGGYPGGAATSGSSPAGPGFGPGGGAPGSGGTNTANDYLIPLVGGSGGGGGGYGGGGGGGAILIASSVSIGIYHIDARGGLSPSCSGGVGAGGSVRLVAPTIGISSSILLNRSQDCNAPQRGGPGRMRIESFNAPGGDIQGPVTYGSPYNTFLTATIPPTLRVTSVNGVPVSQPSTGTFEVPDVTINTNSPVMVQIQASQVPVGTVANLVFYSDNGPDIAISSTPLQGTLAASTATATVTFPPGYTRGIVTASF